LLLSIFEEISAGSQKIGKSGVAYPRFLHSGGIYGDRFYQGGFYQGRFHQDGFHLGGFTGINAARD
jgi:hypothetical protein